MKAPLAPPQPVPPAPLMRELTARAASRARLGGAVLLAALLAGPSSGCSFFAYGRPVVVPPPGGGDPATTVGATVECRRNRWPVALDVLGIGGGAAIGATLIIGTVIITGLSGSPAVPPSGVMAIVLLPSGVYLSSALYGAVRANQCQHALVAAARAKLRREPLRLPDAIYEPPAGEERPPGPPPPGPPQSVAQPPR